MPGKDVTLSVTAIGSDLSYQWRKADTPVSGATSATLTLTAVTSRDAGSYCVTVTNAGGATTSGEAVITVLVPPTIIGSPAPQTVAAGTPVEFAVTATGSGPISYQWLRDGSVMAGETNSSLTMSIPLVSDSGRYAVKVSNGAGTITTAGCELAVLPISRISNLSILTALGSAGDSFTVGTVIGGGGTGIAAKPLLIRAVGPSLCTFGVPGLLDDPKLDLFCGSAVVSSNDNWGGGAPLADAMTQVGAFGLTGAGSKDAVVNYRAAPGGYTINVSGVGAASGAVIAEIYDATPTATFVSSTPRLVNVSVLKNVDGGMTAGFVIGPPDGTPKTVLIRAIGPTLALAPFNVPDALVDPKLELYRGGATTPMGTNNDWAGDTALAAAFTKVGAFALPPTSKDAALMVTLAPGSYTAQVSGVGGATGLALIEIYEVP